MLMHKITPTIDIKKTSPSSDFAISLTIMHQSPHHCPFYPRPPPPPPPPIIVTLPHGATPSPAENVIYVQQTPVGLQGLPTEDRDWTTCLFGCLTDITSCMKTILCPCVTSAEIVEIVSEGRTSCWEALLIFGIFGVLLYCPCIFTCHIRTKMRRKFKLKGNFCTDCLAHTCCLCCALCQEYRELDHQGFDPSLGWLENIDRQRHAVAVFRVTPPPTQATARS